MSRRYNPRLDKRLVAARREVILAKQRLKKLKLKVQKECTHPYVIECPWRPREWVGASPAMRICLCCGYEEHTAYGTWPGNQTEGSCSMQTNYNKKTVLNTEFVKKVSSSDEIIRNRV